MNTLIYILLIGLFLFLCLTLYVLYTVLHPTTTRSNNPQPVNQSQTSGSSLKKLWSWFTRTRVLLGIGALIAGFLFWKFFPWGTHTGGSTSSIGQILSLYVWRPLLSARGIWYFLLIVLGFFYFFLEHLRTLIIICAVIIVIIIFWNPLMGHVHDEKGTTESWRSDPKMHASHPYFVKDKLLQAGEVYDFPASEGDLFWVIPDSVAQVLYPSTGSDTYSETVNNFGNVYDSKGERNEKNELQAVRKGKKYRIQNTLHSVQHIRIEVSHLKDEGY
jgi:hypothetical protein